ncbi:MAG: hypothetical protein AAF206_16460 [Bacteroidota bacterium]
MKAIFSKLSVLLFSLFALPVYANMAQPMLEGSFMTRPFVSQSVDIASEDLRIVLNEDFSQAHFSITYHIQAEKSGEQIPLMFYASEAGELDLPQNFQVWFDEEVVEVKDVPEELKADEAAQFYDFGWLFADSTYGALIEDSPNGGFYVNQSDFFYFETDIPAGKHEIRVEYDATVWIDLYPAVRQYQFRYALSPAEYWKSFGQLHLEVDARAFSQPIKSNLGKPDKGQIDSIAHWTFEDLPVPVLRIEYHPEVSQAAQFLISIGSFPFVFLILLVLGVLQIVFMRWHRTSRQKWRIEWVAIPLALFIPILSLYPIISFDSWLSWLIGPEAGGINGYGEIFLAMFAYPVLVIGYGGLMKWIYPKLPASAKRTT